jgi:hypothetical protein
MQTPIDPVYAVADVTGICLLNAGLPVAAF